MIWLLFIAISFRLIPVLLDLLIHSTVRYMVKYRYILLVAGNSIITVAYAIQDSGAWQKLTSKLEDRKVLLISGADLTDKLLSSDQTTDLAGGTTDQPSELPIVNCASLNVANTSTLLELCHKTKQLKGDRNLPR